MGQHYAPETIFDGKSINFFTYTQNGWVRELHKKMNCLQQRFAIQWYLARPCIISGQDARTTRNFGIFFKLEVS
jgi:hypothetical protein